MVNLINIYNTTQNPKQILTFLNSFGLIPSKKLCSKCGNQMEIKIANNYPDGFAWRCQAKFHPYAKSAEEQCSTMRSLRDGTFFGGGSNLSMFQMIGFMHMWARGCKQIDIAHELGMNYSTCVHWSSLCREIVLIAFTKCPQKIGGVGRTVEVDESKFGKRKYWRGHKVEGCWVFGGLERQSGKVFMEVVEKRDSDTLVPLIKKWILPGSTIVSDYWRAYDCLEAHGYKHVKVNHSINFVDKDDPTINTNRIESTWRHCKESFSTHGRVKEHVPGNLARYMFVKAVRSKGEDVTEEFLRMTARVYADKEQEDSGAELDDEDLNIFE